MHGTLKPELLLTKHTFVCLTDGVLVFLNLRADRYTCLERKYTRPIGALLGLPALTSSGADPEAANADDGTIRETVKTMIDSDFATRDPSLGKRAKFVEQRTELREMLGYEIGKAPKVRAGHVLRFLKALILTKFLLRFVSIERTVTRVKRRRARHIALGGRPPSDERINELVEIYKILKPLFVTVKDQCVYNSLFLIEFLAIYRVYPSWYFGVRLNDFYAHCWVQDGDIVYDDFVDNTSQNQPIMVV